jgi:ATP dependent DNA ligase domain
VLIAFDLIELEGENLRRAPIEHRKQKLSRLVRTPHPGIVLNEHYDGDGDIVFKYACKLGCEGIVSKRLGSPYRSGAFAALGQGKKSKGAGSQTRGRGGLGQQAMSQPLLQVLIVVAFGALCFGCGYLTAFIVTRNRWRDEMIKRGVARYNWHTGKWEWGEPPKESRY